MFDLVITEYRCCPALIRVHTVAEQAAPGVTDDRARCGLRAAGADRLVMDTGEFAGPGARVHPWRHGGLELIVAAHAIGTCLSPSSSVIQGTK